MEALAFTLGMIFFYTRSYLALFFLVAGYWLRPHWKIGVSFIAAWLVGGIHEWRMADVGLPKTQVMVANIRGEVTSIPNHTPEMSKLILTVDHLNERPVKARLLLSCYRQCPEVHAGEYWQLRAQLKRVHSLNNPGSIDYKQKLAVQHIHWRGTSIVGSWQRLKIHTHSRILTLREFLFVRLEKLLADQHTLGIVSALTLGVTAPISNDLWTLFRQTGTTHLMVISGAHIGLISGLVFKGFKWIWSLVPALCIRYPAQRVAAVIAVFVGFLYALLAGFAVPAERSAIASVFIFSQYLGRKKLSVWQAWRYALWGVLLTEPHAIYMPGFYLSFMAVAILIMTNRRFLMNRWLKGLMMQLACLLGLLPLTLYWFSYGAMDGMLANILAIPWVSFILVPLSLVTLLIGQYNSWLVWITQQSTHGLLSYLHWVDSTCSGFNLNSQYPEIAIAILNMLALVLIVLLPLASIRPLILAIFCLMAYPKRDAVHAEDLHISVLDVGQGLAVVVRTETHVLIYDTGGQWYHGPDMGRLVLLPYLKFLGVKQLDAIVISHPDLDHRGGLQSLELVYPSKTLLVDNPDFYHRGQSCHGYPDWEWDGVKFHFFAIPQLGNGKNNRSCVLKISHPGGQILLAGDIEREAEAYLAHTYQDELRSTVLVVPHHGSRTSSTLAFLDRVSPQYAILSYGFANRYHFPHRQTLMHYQQRGIRLYHTARQGMIRIVFHHHSVQCTP